MTPSTERTDQLLEWHPGAGEAATTNPLTALGRGFRRAAGSKLLIGYLWLLHLFLVEGAGKALLAWLRGATTSSEATDAVAANVLQGSLFAATDAGYVDILLASMSRTLWSPTSWFVAFYGVAAAGAIAWLHVPRPAPLLAQLGANSGAFAGRFLRLILIGALFYGATVWLAATLFETSAAGDEIWVRILMFQVAIGTLGAVIDYARVRTIARDSRSMVLETWRSAIFFGRNLPRTVALELAVIAVTFVAGAAMLTVADALRGIVPDVRLAAVAEQVWVIATLTIQLATWGAMLALFQGLTLARLRRTVTG